MADFFEDLAGSAGGYMGQVGGFDIGAQPEPTFTTPAAPAQTFSATETGYTPTFDFSSFLSALPNYGMPAVNYQAPQVNFFNPADYPVFGAEPAAAKVKPGQQGFQYPGATTIDPTSGMLRSVSPAEVGGTVISPEQAAPPDKADFFQSLLGKGFSTADALKLALGIGGGIMGMSAQKKAADEAAAAEAEYKAAAAKAAGQYSGLAQPYLTAGGSQLSMALQGALSPAQMQQFQASQAQLAQGAERTGGVGSIQSAAALQNLYQQALQNQQNMALQLLGPGNQLASNAINTELQGTQGGLKLGLDLATQANQASMNMYSAIASMIGGQRPSTQTATS
jgi:hypothetical protein